MAAAIQNRPANALALPPCNWSPLFRSGEDILVTGVCYERPFRAQLALGPLRNRVALQNQRREVWGWARELARLVPCTSPFLLGPCPITVPAPADEA